MLLTEVSSLFPKELIQAARRRGQGGDGHYFAGLPSGIHPTRRGKKIDGAARATLERARSGAVDFAVKREENTDG